MHLYSSWQVRQALSAISLLQLITLLTGKVLVPGDVRRELENQPRGVAGVSLGNLWNYPVGDQWWFACRFFTLVDWFTVVRTQLARQTYGGFIHIASIRMDTRWKGWSDDERQIARILRRRSWATA